MNANFPRTLSLLRKEKGISQKKAAEELMISQALLSHYENGVREPGLQFVVKAADFYGVSADFLLGRTMARDGTGLHEEDVPDAGEERDNVLRGSAAVLLSKKILTNSIGVL
ncbi:helix-turn-helix domain-containing protein, partial [Oscillospiraceae bacterium OttesenSCG-928-G22]|nr:helix-turn-helix domain-containing protein [Oscillospiraceae bacterium OttesenSCG-928-G22]